MTQVSCNAYEVFFFLAILSGLIATISGNFSGWAGKVTIVFVLIWYAMDFYWHTKPWEPWEPEKVVCPMRNCAYLPLSKFNYILLSLLLTAYLLRRWSGGWRDR